MAADCELVTERVQSYLDKHKISSLFEVMSVINANLCISWMKLHRNEDYQYLCVWESTE